MPPIYLIAGSPASGKSTLARLLAQRAAKGLHIPVDDLRTMVHGGVVHPGPVWSKELVEQLKLAPDRRRHGSALPQGRVPCGCGRFL